MEVKYGKFVAFGLLLLTIAGCGKAPSVATQDEIDRNKQMQQDMNSSGTKR